MKATLWVAVKLDAVWVQGLDGVPLGMEVKLDIVEVQVQGATVLGVVYVHGEVI